MNTYDLFEAFDQRITASKAEGEAAIHRLFDCEAALSAHYHPGAPVGSHVTLIGSIAKSTAVSPVADADGVFHMPAGTHTRFDSYTGNGQSALLQEVRSVLMARYPRTRIRGDGPVVVVEFTSGPNVEIVPGVLFSPGTDILHARCKVPFSRDGGSWEDADYGLEYDNAATLHTASGGQYARLIRYMKAWRTAQGATIKSVVLELMAAQFMRRWDTERNSYVYDDWLVRDFLSHMVENYYSTYALPSGKRIDTGVGWYERAKQSHADATRACGFSDSSSTYLSGWKRVLGSGFGA